MGITFLIGITLGIIGKILLGLTVMLVHHRVVLEHRIDNAVIREMKRERWLALIAMIMMLVGFLFELKALGYIEAIAAI